MARKFGPSIHIVEKSSSNFQNESLIVYNNRKKSLDNCGRLEIQLLSMTSPDIRTPILARIFAKFSLGEMGGLLVKSKKFW